MKWRPDEQENGREWESERKVWCVRCYGIMAFCGSHISDPSVDSLKALRHSLLCKMGRNNLS